MNILPEKDLNKAKEGLAVVAKGIRITASLLGNPDALDKATVRKLGQALEMGAVGLEMVLATLNGEQVELSPAAQLYKTPPASSAIN